MTGAATAVGPEPLLEAAALFPELRSRDRRFKSARSSAAVWQRRSRILLEQLVEDLLEGQGQLGIGLAGRPRRAVQNAVEDDRGGGAGERKLARGHLVEHDAQRKKVGTVVEFFAARLLQGHICDGAHGTAGAGQLQRGLDGTRAAGSGADRLGVFAHHGGELGEPEIENFCRAAVDQKNVGGLDVAVDDAFGVRRIKAAGNLNADLQQFRQLDAALGDAVLESLALQQFHGDERTAFEFADVVNGADVRMVERRCGARLAVEALDGCGIVRRLLGEKFERDTAPQPGVAGAVHHAHSAAAQWFQAAVVRDGTSAHRV